jgi:hypothetical protein
VTTDRGCPTSRFDSDPFVSDSSLVFPPTLAYRGSLLSPLGADSGGPAAVVMLKCCKIQYYKSGASDVYIRSDVLVLAIRNAHVNPSARIDLCLPRHKMNRRPSGVLFHHAHPSPSHLYFYFFFIFFIFFFRCAVEGNARSILYRDIASCIVLLSLDPDAVMVIFSSELREKFFFFFFLPLPPHVV